MVLRVSIVAVTLLAALAQSAPVFGVAHSGAVAASDDVSLIVTRPGSDTVRSTLSRGPILVGGTYLLPAREIFTALGYAVRANGAEMTASATNVTTRSHAMVVSMRLGDQTATVDGAARAVSPGLTLIGGALFVPLRFVAATTGDDIRYDRGGHTVYVTIPQSRSSNAATPPVSIDRMTQPPATPATPASAPEPSATPEPAPTPLPTPTPIVLPTPSIVLRLVREEPARGTTVDRERPEISASFGEPVAAASVRILLDGREITTDATVTDRYFSYEPTEDLQPGAHTIAVAGRTPLHEAFADRWSFDSAPAKGHNFLSGVEPPSGITVTSPLVVSGITKPRSRVGMVATSSETAAHFSELSGGAYSDHTSADARGNFEFRLDLVDTGSGFVDIRLDSTAPGGAVAVKTLRLRL